MLSALTSPASLHVVKLVLIKPKILLPNHKVSWFEYCYQSPIYLHSGDEGIINIDLVQILDEVAKRSEC